jgi:hypothetical protein
MEHKKKRGFELCFPFLTTFSFIKILSSLSNHLISVEHNQIEVKLNHKEHDLEN